MPEIELKKILDSKHPILKRLQPAIEREERRLVGGVGILPELVQFKGFEDDTSHQTRQAWARWLPFGKRHVALCAGHVLRHLQPPAYGAMGERRPRTEVSGKQSDAERFHYNVNGIGFDGLQLPTYLDGLLQRALATYWRWVMVEMPSIRTLNAIRRRLGSGQELDPVNPPTVFEVTDEERAAGWRPYWVERSPLAGHNWRVIDGVLQWVNFKIPPERDLDFEEGAGDGSSVKPWSYLLVRQGYAGLGERFVEGGWWKFDADHRPQGHGVWADTDGEIPGWMQVGVPGEGTYTEPEIGQSVTWELGQISADVMNAISEQRFNLRQAAKTVNFGMGVDGRVQKQVVEQLGDGTTFVGVAPVIARDGNTVVVPQMWNSSAAAIDAGAYNAAIEPAIQHAKEIMLRQVTAGANASGERVENEHAAQASPLLSSIAAAAESGINTGLYFTARRFGYTREQAQAISVELPREFPLRDVVADIDSMLKELREAGVRSATWERELLLQKGDEMGALPDEEREAIEAELRDKATDRENLERLKLQAETKEALERAGAANEAAARAVGFTPAQIRELFGPGERRVAEPGAALPAGVEVDRRAQPPAPQPAPAPAPTQRNGNGRTRRAGGDVVPLPRNRGAA